MTTSFFDPVTGAISGRTVGCSDKLLAINTPRGLVAIEGEFDADTQRVDVEALAKAGPDARPEDFVVDAMPPQPSPDHELGADIVTGRPKWVLTAAAAGREAKDRAARERLREIDGAMMRPAIALLKDPADSLARQRLNDLEIEAAEVRKDVIKTADEVATAERLTR
jgi:hypothetical protein